MKPTVSRKKEIIKIRVEVNKIETKRQQKISMKLKTGSLKRQTKLINLSLDSKKRDMFLIKSETKEEK